MRRLGTPVLAALALLVGLWNAWSLGEVRGRLAALETRRGATEVAASAPPARGGPRERVAAASVAGAAGGEVHTDEVLREQVVDVLAAEEQRREEERAARFREAVQTELQAFAEEEGLDPATTSSVSAELDRRGDAFRALREALQDGSLSPLDGRREMDALREESAAVLDELLGEDRARRLEERVFPGPPGGNGGRPPGPPPF